MDEREALRLVVKAADDLCAALEESDDVKLLGSDFEFQFTALEGALAALPGRQKGRWTSVEEDWRQDAPGG